MTEGKKRRRHITLVAAISFAVVALPFGLTSGIDIISIPSAGNTIFPCEDVDVKLLEINVVMKRELGKMTEVTATYLLENRNNEKVSFNMAFPIEPADAIKPKDFYAKINGYLAKISQLDIREEDFHKRIRRELSTADASAEEKIEYKRLEAIKKFKLTAKDKITVFIWRVSFKPKEIKTVHCNYFIDWDGSNMPTEVLRFYLAPSALWKGNIEKVQLKLILPRELVKLTTQTGGHLKVFPLNYFTVKNNIIEWSFKNYKSAGYRTEKNVFVALTYGGSGE